MRAGLSCRSFLNLAHRNNGGFIRKSRQHYTRWISGPATITSPLSDALQEKVNRGFLQLDADQLRAASVLDKLLTLAEAQHSRLQMRQNREAELADPPEGIACRHEGSNGGAGDDGPQASEMSTAQPQASGSRHQSSEVRPPPVCGTPLHEYLSLAYVIADSPSHAVGKTMLMDMFASELTARNITVRRMHFHDFMLETHAKLHAFQQAIPLVTTESLNGRLVHRQAIEPNEDPIQAVAQDLRRLDDGSEATFLCFDELHVTDVADAMILSRLFQHIISAGTLVAFTSNQRPADLYTGGLSRDFFLPFVQLIVSKAVVLHFGSTDDYRRQPGVNRAAAGEWLAGASGDMQESLLWQMECGTDEPIQWHPLPLGFGRTLYVPQSVRALQGRDTAAARFSFEDLCGTSGSRVKADQGGALGPNDFTCLARAFGTLHVTQVPRFTSSRRDEVRRWITLLDCLYELPTRLICQAEVSVADMFDGISLEAEAELLRCSSRPSNDDRPSPAAVANPSASESMPMKPAESAFDGALPGVLREELLMYKRAASRLAEMCGTYD